MDELVKYLRALVLMQINASFQPVGAGATVQLMKPEVVLSRAGFAHKEIAEMLGKSQAAIAKSISRAKVVRLTDAEPGTGDLPNE